MPVRDDDGAGSGGVHQPQIGIALLDDHRGSRLDPGRQELDEPVPYRSSLVGRKQVGGVGRRLKRLVGREPGQILEIVVAAARLHS